MKRGNYIIFGLLLFCKGLSSYAQCGVTASVKNAITCGGSTSLQVDGKWDKVRDNANYFHSIHFPNVNTGYAVGENGLIHKTVDGGVTWTAKNYGTTNYEAVFFTDENTGFIGGASTILKTVDGGNTWTPPVSITSFMGHDVYDFYFVNANVGFAVCNQSQILKTTDGGLNWTSKFGPSTPNIMAIHFPTTDAGYAVGQSGYFFKSKDGGETWQFPGNIPFSNALKSVYFTDAATGYIGCSDGTILKTTDSAKTWTMKIIAPQSVTFEAMFFVNAQIGYAAGGQSIWKTTDAGLTWNQQLVNADVYDLSFVNASKGFVTGTKTIELTEPTTISWSPASGLNSTTIANPIASPNKTTTYTVTTTVGSCTGVDSIKVVVNPLTADAGADKTIICGGSVKLDTVKTNYTGSGILTYFWTPATGLSSSTSISPVVTVKSTTTFYVTVSTPNGCFAVDSVKVIVDPFTANAGLDKDLVCGGTAQLDAVTTNYTGSGILTYSWTPANGLSATNISDPSVKSKTTTTYYVTVTNPVGCTATDSVKVVVNPLMIDAGVDQTIICGGKTKFYSPLINYTGNEKLSYVWSPANSLDSDTLISPTSNANKKTVYHVTLTTANGCVATDSLTIFVTPFIANSSGPVSLICGGSKQFNDVVTNYTGTDALTYSWLPSAGLNDPAIVKPTVTITTTGSYTLTVATSNGCQAKDTVIVNVDPLLANAGADKMNMCGDSVLLDNVTSNYTGTAPLTYSWLPATGLHNATVSNPLTGAHDLTYTVTVTTSNGCQASDQVRVDLKPMDAPEICMVGVDSTNKNVIRWNDLLWDAIDSVIIYRETTVAGNYVKIGSTAFSKNGFRDLTSQPEVKSNKYKISLLDTCGLESSKSVQHKTMHLAITKGVGTSWNLIWEPYEGFAVPTYNIYRGTDVNNLQFIDATSGTSTQFTNYNPPPGDLYYQVEVVNPNPCDPSNVAKALRSNVAASKYVGIFEQHENTFKFNLYPNPAADLVTLNAENASTKNTLIIIYNSIGAVVKSVPLQQNMQQIDVSDLSNGFYMVELKSVNGHAVQKLTIEK